MPAEAVDAQGNPRAAGLGKTTRTRAPHWLERSRPEAAAFLTTTLGNRSATRKRRSSGHPEPQETPPALATGSLRKKNSFPEKLANGWALSCRARR
jgi:hypothetical protein